MRVTETEWVSLVSVAGTLASGLLASRVTFRTTQRSITANDDLARKERKHDSEERARDRAGAVALADRNREQERRLAGYIAVQTVVHAIDQYAMAHSVGLRSADQDSTAFPVVPPEVEAHTQLIASQEIVMAMDELNIKLGLLQIAIQDARYWRDQVSGGVPGAKEYFHKANANVGPAAQEVTDAATSVHLQMRRELLSETSDDSGTNARNPDSK
jgi:hypothetical protein